MQHVGAVTLLAVSLNPRIKDKPGVWEPEYADNWQSQEITLAKLQESIGMGHAFIAAGMSSTHRSSAAFVHADLAAVDIDHGLDIEDFHTHQLASRACLLCTTSSHASEPGKHRFRVFFRLPERITDPDSYCAVVTALIHSLGGKKNFKDPCQYFYGNSRAEFWVNPNPRAMLTRSFVRAACIKLLPQPHTSRRKQGKYDDITIGQADYILKEVLPPTKIGERDHFIQVTKAAASAGNKLYASWSEWAKRGHHGSGRNHRQSSICFFRELSGKTNLGTLINLAFAHSPSWSEELPENLRGTNISNYAMTTGSPSKDLIESADPEGAGFGQEALGAAERQQPSELGLRRTRKRKCKDKKRAVNEIKLIQEKVKGKYPDLRFNKLTGEIEVGLKNAPVLFEDIDTAYLELSEGQSKPFYKTHVIDTIRIIARKNSYNPVRVFLDEAAKEEPVIYFNTIAQTLLGVPEEGPQNPRLPCGDLFADAVIKRFLVGAIARITEPGCSMPWLPILSGLQGTGKTRFIEYLTPRRHDSPNQYPLCKSVRQDIGYLRDHPHALYGGWIGIIDEIDRFFREEYFAEFRNLVSAQTERSRPLYQNERWFVRNFALAGCTSKSGFMGDLAGNRRFMPISIRGVVSAQSGYGLKTVDLSRVQAERMRIWAAAQQTYKDGHPWEFSGSEVTFIQEYLSSWRGDSPLIEALRSVLAHNASLHHEGQPAYTLNDVYRRLKIPLHKSSYGGTAVENELKRLGYTRRHIKRGDKLVVAWMQDSPAPVLPVATLRMTQ